MFTGIIEHKGKILKKSPGKGCLWQISAPFSQELHLGDSVNVNGACHTVTHRQADSFEVFSSAETLKITSFKETQVGDSVNLERAMKLGSRLDGHLVYGHVDGTTKLLNLAGGRESKVFTFKLKSPWRAYLIQKGSIAINGISLTIYQKDLASFQVMIIPPTWDNTTFRELKLGQEVNIELDVVGKYVKNFCRGNSIRE